MTTKATIDMDVSLYTKQLNQALQSTAENQLEAVCDLLRVHTEASVSIEHNGRVVFECLYENSGDAHILRTGCLTLRREKDFSDAEKLAADIALCICTILLRHRDELLYSEKKRRAKAVRAMINSLSYSELEAATHAIKHICAGGESEGLLVAGHIADKLGFTRSVVTSALRKLEGANLIETRSLGMKGTYIRVKDAMLTEELGKL